ncbi:MAG: MFS transporter [Paraprevotella sp.]|nr:MFS transporter [Paraprevotella sp.]
MSHISYRPKGKRSPWAWIPTLYFAEALPYLAVMTISTIMYKRLGISNTDIAFYTSWLYLPWVIKPFWSPIVDLLKTKRWWTIIMELCISVSLACVAWTIPGPYFFKLSLAFFWLMAFSSATHDIAADGYYMQALTAHEQSLFVGIRSTFYRLGMILGKGLLVIIAGELEIFTRDVAFSWSMTFYVLAVLFILFTIYHRFVLPCPTSDRQENEPRNMRVFMNEFWETIVSFCTKKQANVAILFMLLYRFPEALLVKITDLFLIDPVSEGGLGLSTIELGWVQGTVGIIGLTLGGILGGIAVSIGGLKKWLWPMVISISLPDIVYVYLAYAQTTSLNLISTCIFVEQFGYGFGFTAYMLYLIYYSQGKHQTAHYAFCTGLMALSMMLPGMIAGYLQESLGYTHFFWLVMVCTGLTFLVSICLKIDSEFGKKKR